MHILLAAATTFEIQPAIDFLTQPLSRRRGHETDTLITGVGCMATVYSLKRQIDRLRPDIIIQAGIAGCWTGRQPGEVFAVREDLPGDQGVWEDGQFRSVFDLKLADKDGFPFTDGLLVNPHKKLLTLTSLETVRGITVNEITTDPRRIEYHERNNLPVVESMEGAGLHYVCLLEGIAFLQLRSVSNDIGVRDKTKWDIKKAIDRLNDRLIFLLEKLYKEDGIIIDP
jgi:futalosine hydrolase